MGKYISSRKHESRSLGDEAGSVSGATLQMAPFLVALDAMIAMDDKGVILEFSPSAETMFGYSRDEAVGRELARLIIPPRFRSAHRIGLAQYLRSGQGKLVNKRVELAAVRRSGEEFPVELYVTQVNSEEPAIFIGTIRDISEQRKADVALRSNEQHWLSLLEGSSEGVLLLGLKGELLFASTAAAGILGYTTSELLDIKKITSLTHPEDRVWVQRRFKRIIKAGVSVNATYRVLAKDGSYRWLKVAAKNAVKDYTVGGIIVNFRDVTSEKQAREELAASEQRYRFVVQNTAEIITIFSKSGEIVFQSPSITKVLGLNDNRVGRSVFQSPLVYPDDQAKASKYLEKLIRSKPGAELRNEFRMLHADGSWRFMEVVGVNLLHIQEVSGVMVSARDVTERRLSEQQKDEFIAVASHELRTPVTSMKAYVALLERKFSRSGDMAAAESIGAIDDQLDKLNLLVRDLLDISRMDAGQLRLTAKSFDYAEMVRKSVAATRLTAQDHIVSQSGIKKLIINADCDRLSQVLTNLLENAVKYSPYAGRVSVNLSLKDGQLITRVADNGIGIPKGQQSHLFERFARVGGRQAAGFPGLGLGLYISAQIIARMGGKIWVDSRAGQGSKFYFSLPFAKIGKKNF